MDESPDQILARLERHAESVRRAGRQAPAAPVVKPAPVPYAAPGSGLPSRALLRNAPSTAPRPSAPVPSTSQPPSRSAAQAGAPSAGAAGPRVVHWGGERASDLIPEETAAFPRFGLLLRTVAGQVLAVICCILALIASIYLSVPAALAVVGALTVAGAVAAAKRVPLTGWCTLGLVIGWTLGRFS